MVKDTKNVPERRLLTAHLKGIIVNDCIMALLHSDTITDKEQFIADFTEIVNNFVISSEDLHNY